VTELVKHDTRKKDDDKSDTGQGVPSAALDQVHRTNPDQQEEERRMNPNCGPRDVEQLDRTVYEHTQDSRRQFIW
jgi:hypothetical protein